MKKNIKFLFISVFLVAASMVNAISGAVEAYAGCNSLGSFIDESGDKAEDKQKPNEGSNKTEEKSEETDVPKPVSANQLSANIVEITFNIPVEQKSATKSSNYWVQSTGEEKPSGIATLGKSEKLSAANALNDDLVKIEPSSESGRVIKLTFKNNITSGAEHKIHIYFVAPKGAEVYKGQNGAIIFKAK